MPTGPSIRVVIDTNVLFEGLTRRGGATGLVVEAWLAGLLSVYVSNALAYEYTDVLSRKLSKKRWAQLQPVLGRLLAQAQFVTLYFSWRPTSPDKADEHVIDCAMNAGAAVITANLRHFRTAQHSLGLEVMTPLDLIVKLALE
jgi:predicted nucleic acid-binding protein